MEDNRVLEEKDIEFELSVTDQNKLYVEAKNLGEDVLYSFHIFLNGKMIDKVAYNEQNKMTYWMNQTGTYQIKVCAKRRGDKTGIGVMSEEVLFDAKEWISSGTAERNKEPVFWERVFLTTREIVDNFIMLLRIARYDYRLKNKDAHLGKLWSLLTPLIQIGTFWLVFGLGLRSGRDVDGHPYMVWMLSGLIPWFFISEAITKGANAIYSKGNTVVRMKFPIATVPVSAVFTAFFEHLVMLALMYVMLFYHGYFPTWYHLNLIYYVIYSLFFLCSLAMVTSVFTMLARDFQKVLVSFMRLLFYVTPILWTMDRMPKIYQDILKLNPVLYVVDGFRESILFDEPFYYNVQEMCFFWGINFVLWIVGCNLQYKYKKKFIDLR